MVALEFARGRAVAVAIVALLTITLLPLPAAQAQVTTATNVFVEQGTADLYQQAFQKGATPTSFVTNDNAFTQLRLPIFQTGAADLEDVPVYWFIYATTGGGDLPSPRAGCVIATTLPGAETGEDSNSTLVSIDIRTDDLPFGGYKVSVWALRNPFAPNTPPPGCGDPNGLTRPCSETTGGGGIGGTLPDAGCVTEPVTESQAENDNHLTAYFVKHASVDPHIAEIRWCEATPNTSGGVPNPCDEDMLVDGQPYNATVQTGTRNTFFQVVVENKGNWTDRVDYGGPCNCSDNGWEYELAISVTGNLTDKVNLSRRTNFSYNPIDETTHRAHSTRWNITNLTGTYNVSVTLDPAKELRYPATSTASHAGARDAHVMYRDYVGTPSFTGAGSSQENPFPYDGPFTISGSFTFKNDGTVKGLAGATVGYSIYIDNTTNTVHKTSGTISATDPDVPTKVDFSFSASSSLSSTQYIPPGKHTIYGFIDSANSTLELNETNNIASVDIYLADDTTPRFDPVEPFKLALTGPGLNSGNTPPKWDYYPHQTFRIYANVTDDDAGMTVIANFTLKSDPSVSREYRLTGSAVAKTLSVQDFDFHNWTNRSADGTETWVIRVRANDSSDNNVTTATKEMVLKPWPIHVVDTETILEVPTDWPNETVVEWRGNDHPDWKIRVLPGWTGFDGNPTSQTTNPCPCQQNYTENLAYNVTTPKRTFNVNGSGWEFQTPWTETSPCRIGTDEDSPLDLAPADRCPEALNNTFTASFAKDQEGAGPGRWNYSVRIADRAGHERVINGTFLILDSAPTIHVANISASSATPGGNVTVLANVSDDDNTITAAHVVFERSSPGDGAIVNLSLGDSTEDGGIFSYNETFKVGRNEIFGLGGTFNVNVSVSDLTGNWNRTSLGQFVVDDQDAPVVASYGVVPAVAEVGENVTFYAKVTDSTNVSVKLEVFRTTTSSELLMDAIQLTEGLDGNFTTSLNVTTEGVYAWRLTPVDSVNRAGSLAEGTLTIRDNLGPRYDVRSPLTVIDGVRYGSGKPRIEIVVFDLEGVQMSTLDMKVAGLPVDYSVSPAPGNLNGYLLSYTVPASKKFNHGDVVEVNLTAVDNSSEALRSYENFTFKVDDVAPIARMTTVSPSYRDQPAHVLNVSLNSRITLVGEDNDNMPTDVESIRYKILGGGVSTETVYSGPFRINDAPGVYTGPRLYTIQFWAEDDVGNINPVFNVTTVYVDDTPPALFQFFPQGRSINATFVDDRVGVNRSVVWYRENNEPYVPLPLVEKDGAWSLTLPEGVKGDTVSYYLQAWDRLDNTETFGSASAPYANFSVDNHEPKIRITGPVDGSRIFRSVDITWEASDEDGDALVFTVYYKAPGKQNFVELAKIENSATRRYTLDSTRFPDGQYTFRVAAGDGGFVKLSETTVTILNRASAVGVVNVLGDGVPGESMLIKAEITKAEAIVEARLFLDGDLVESYPMNDEGRDGDEVANDGFYSVRVPIQTAGDYSVEIFTQYREDGELKEASIADAATFSAKLTPGYLLTEYGAVIAVIGLLAAVGIGVAVFVVMRRR